MLSGRLAKAHHGGTSGDVVCFIQYGGRLVRQLPQTETRIAPATHAVDELVLPENVFIVRVRQGLKLEGSPLRIDERFEHLPGSRRVPCRGSARRDVGGRDFTASLVVGLVVGVEEILDRRSIFNMPVLQQVENERIGELGGKLPHALEHRTIDAVAIVFDLGSLYGNRVFEQLVLDGVFRGRKPIDETVSDPFTGCPEGRSAMRNPSATTSISEA